jgi:hypothetical protein
MGEEAELPAANGQKRSNLRLFPPKPCITVYKNKKSKTSWKILKLSAAPLLLFSMISYFQPDSNWYESLFNNNNNSNNLVPFCLYSANRIYRLQAYVIMTGSSLLRFFCIFSRFSGILSSHVDIHDKKQQYLVGTENNEGGGRGKTGWKGR